VRAVGGVGELLTADRREGEVYGWVTAWRRWRGEKGMQRRASRGDKAPTTKGANLSRAKKR
jgi:hypothetical protein